MYSLVLSRRANVSVGSLTAAQDFANRLAAVGSNLVWYHDFDSSAEVDAFRWTNGFSGGNDPNSVGSSRVQGVFHRPTAGVGGGGCLECLRPAGTSEANDWWRPLSPIVGSGNGRGIDDPGAGGTITPQAYAPTSGGSQIANWGEKGYYGHISYHSGGAFDGTEYYLQMRIKMDPRRATNGNSLVGKLTFQTTTKASLTVQEIVTYSGGLPPGGGTNFFRMYGGGTSDPLEDKDSIGGRGQQPGSVIGVCDISSAPQNCWAWSGGWDTVLYRMVPGRAGVEESIVQVYAAHEGETEYTLIWDETWANAYEIGTGFRNGYNALICSTYQNGQDNTEFWHRYDQIIFSKSIIACPLI